MATFNSIFPTFLGKCADLHTLLLSVAFALFVTGIIITVAGSGDLDPVGDGGPARAARNWRSMTSKVRPASRSARVFSEATAPDWSGRTVGPTTASST